MLSSVLIPAGAGALSSPPGVADSRKFICLLLVCGMSPCLWSVLSRGQARALP